MTIEYNRRASDQHECSEHPTMQDCERVEGKLDRLEESVAVLGSKLTQDHEAEHEYIRRALAREARLEKLHMAIIEKTLTALLWSVLVGLAALLWQSFKDHLK